MSKKDYVAIAGMLRELRAWNAGNHDKLGALDEVALALADHFESDNGCFDRQRFLSAAGWE